MKHKKLSILLLVAMLMFSFIQYGCSNKSKNPENDQTTSTTASTSTNGQVTSTVDTSLTGGLVMPLTQEKVKYEWMMNEHPSYPVDVTKWEAFQKIEEMTNVEIEFIIVPEASFRDRMTIVMASGDIPDILGYEYPYWKSATKEGTLLELSQYFGKEYTPNLSSYFEKYPDIKPQVMELDGKSYYFPHFQTDGPSQSWLVRKDILEKENLTQPETMEQFIDLCRTLKSKYPNITPITFRTVDAGKIFIKFEDAYGVYADPDNLIPVINGKAQFGLDDPRVLQMVKDVYTLYSEKLIDQDYPLVKASTWEERVLNGKALLTMDWNTRVEDFNNKNKNAATGTGIEGFEMIRMLPPVPENGTGQLPGRNALNDRMTLLSAKIKNPEVAVKFIDTFYSPIGVELNEWGIEGKTFEKDANGGKKYTSSVKSDYNTDTTAPDKKTYGMNYNWISHDIDLNYVNENDMKSPAWDSWIQLCREKDRIMPTQIKLAASEDETAEWAEKYSAIQKHFSENIDLFIMGKRSISEWDKFISEIKSLGVDDLIKIRQTQYNRATK